MKKSIFYDKHLAQVHHIDFGHIAEKAAEVALMPTMDYDKGIMHLLVEKRNCDKLALSKNIGSMTKLIVNSNNTLHPAF